MLKRCTKCNKELELNDRNFYYYLNKGKGKYFSSCVECERERSRIKTRKRRAENPERARFLQKEWRKRNPERASELGRRHRRNVRMEMFIAYGGNPPKCSCCGESGLDFLSLDHIDNNGAESRRMFGGGIIYYRRLRRLGYPKGYQILCYNCNMAKSFTGNNQCPHVQKTNSREDNEWKPRYNRYLTNPKKL